ncbi:MAG: hypothetical protein JO002_12150 [Burkholderiaceae bacterium]|nr:hypothetical protein [Burkholderiaceae bacterium]
MVLFGGHDGLYASHMPMFHPPHDAQVILSFHITDPKIEQAVRRELAVRPQLWSLVPQEFELNRLAPDAAQTLTDFAADSVKGHFERGGKVRYRQVKVHIEGVPVFRKLDSNERSATEADYFVLAKPGGAEAFAVKRIDVRPDADQIVSFTNLARTVLPATLQLPLQGALSVPADKLEEGLGTSCHCQMKLRAEIYRETGDLE